MLFERLQYQLKRTCKTPKNYEKHVVMEHVRREFIKQQNKAVLNKEKQPHTFDHDESLITCIGKHFVCENIHEKNSVFTAFKNDIEDLYPQEAAEILAQCCPFKAKVFSYKKIRCGNCVFEVKNVIKKPSRYIRKHQKTKMDFYMEIRNKDSPVNSSVSYDPEKENAFPTFARCQNIYAIKPFVTKEKKHNVYYFFKCETMKTSGYHRCLWTIDETPEGAVNRHTKMLKTKDICQLQVVVAQHGKLPVGMLSVMR